MPVKLQSIEGLRFIASIAIVLEHFIFYGVGGHEFWGGSLGIFVDLFFIISGVVIASAYADRVGSMAEYTLFIQRRFARLYPLHLLTTLFYASIGVGVFLHKLHVSNPEKYNFHYLLEYVSLTQAWFPHGLIAFNGVSWSISAELFCYLSFPALLITIRTGQNKGLMFVLGTFAICALISEVSYAKQFVALHVTTSQIRALPTFSLGIWLAIYPEALCKVLNAKATKMLLSAALLIVVATLPLNLGYISLFFVICVVCSAYAADLRGVETFASHPLISSNGRLTYSIYMIHPVVGTLFVGLVAPKIFGTSTPAVVLTIGIALMLAYVLSLVSFRYFEEPLRKILGRPLVKVSHSEAGAIN